MNTGEENTQSFGVFGDPELLRTPRPAAAPADLAVHDCAIFRMPSSGRGRPWQFREHGRAIELHPRAKYHVDDGEGMIALAAAGLALVQTPDFMARAAVDAGALEEVLQEYRAEPLPISVVYPRAPRPTAAAPVDRSACASRRADGVDERKPRSVERGYACTVVRLAFARLRCSAGERRAMDAGAGFEGRRQHRR